MSGTSSGCSYASFLRENPNSEIALVLTGPDRPSGRGRKKKKPRPAEFCLRKEVELFQSDDVNSTESVKILKNLNADIALVVDFGQILSPEVLDIFPSGCFNLHYSLLPDLRGAAPVRRAIMEGRSKTGVTLMKMNRKIDAGEIVFKRELSIEPEYNYRVLKDKLTKEGIILAEKLIKYLSEEKKLPLHPQDSSEATKAPKINKQCCKINWEQSAVDIVNRIRALSPVPGCWTYFKRKNMRLKILKADVAEFDPGTLLSPGEVAESGKKSFSIKASPGAVKVLEVHPSGSRPMKTASFLAGNRVKKGDIFSCS